MVKIRLISYLKQIAGFREKNIRINKPTIIRDLIEFELPDDRIMVIINQTQGGDLDSIVNNDDEVVISPIFGGG